VKRTDESAELMLIVVGLENEKPVGGCKRETVAEGFVEGGLPPAVRPEGVERPSQTLAVDGTVGVHAEDAYLLARETREGVRATYGAEAAAVGEHLEIDAGILLGEGGQVGDIAEGVVLALACGAKNDE